MWRVILFTVLGLIAVGFISWAIYRAGWWAGHAALRKNLGIASQRRIKANEMLVNEAAELFGEMLHPAGLDLDQVSPLSTHHSARVARWLENRRRNS